MIEKLPEIQIHSSAKINEKLNEVIDWINDVSALRVTDKQVTANLPNIDAGELAFLSKENSDLEDELERTRKALDKGMEHITGLNNMIESWYKLLQSDKDTSTKYAILKSAISAYVENKGGDNE